MRLVAVQLGVEATAPLKVTVLVPAVGPKFVPVIVTNVPGAPKVGARLLMVGGGGVTVSVAEPQMAPVQALIVAVPSATPKALPELLASLLTVAMELADELHVTEANVWKAPG